MVKKKTFYGKNPKRNILGLVVICFLLQYGCGTIRNTGNPTKPPSYGDQYLYDDNIPLHIEISPFSNQDKVIYGGVLNDVSILSQPIWFLIWIPTIVDLPLSLVGDTVTLPFTVYWTIETGDSELIYNVRKGHLNKVKKFLSEGREVKTVTAEGKTLLMTAIEQKYKQGNDDYTQIVQVLIKNGASVNETTDDGRTSLMLASKKGFTGIVIMLLNNGADPSLQTDNGRTALDFAREKGRKEVVQLLQKHMSDEEKK